MSLDIERPTPSVLVTRYRPIHAWIVAGLLAVTAASIVAIVVATVPVPALLADTTGLAPAIYVSIMWMACGPACTTAVIGVLFVVFLGRVEVCTLDKGAGTIVFERRGVLGVKTVSRRLDEILAVEVKSRSGSRGRLWNRIYLVSISGERLPIAAWMPVSQVGPKAAQIRTFLGPGSLGTGLW